MNSQDPEIYGLLLTGGKSSRMGSNKSLLEYHGKPQSDHLYELLSKKLSKVFISSKNVDSNNENIIVDQFETKGPINGILSAMKLHPDKAFLVLAVDLPLLMESTIQGLIERRDSTKYATAYATRETNLPEPLVAIWEPKSEGALSQHHFIEGKNCPRKFLINSDVKLVYPEDDHELFNANDPEEAEEARRLMGLS